VFHKSYLKSLSVKTDLSQTLRNRFEDFINVALTQLKSYGVSFRKREEITTLDEIINSYAYPTAQRDLEGLK